jgi:L-glutamine:2-deoxy-scyllo-inosose/3-amino-2,3-dideoxy-scyllo-inosose aminotransferase
MAPAIQRDVQGREERDAMVSGRLAIEGGTPVRAGKQWPVWPVFGRREEELLLAVLRSGEWLGAGSVEVEFALRFAAYQGAAYGDCVANGTCALEIAYAALGVGPGDEVIVPAITFVSTASPAVRLGATVVFVDVDPDTYQLDPRQLEAAITARTKVVVPVHLYSGMVDMDAVLAVAGRHGVRVIEDCAHAQGGRWRRADGTVRGAGSMGDLGTFSFQWSKTLTSGEGGAILTNDRRLADLVWMYKDCGRAPRRTPEHADESGETRVEAAGDLASTARKARAGVLGWNYRLGAFQAAVLLAQLERFDAQADRRIAGARYLDEELARIPGIRPLTYDRRVVRRPFYKYVFRYDPAAFDGLPVEQFRAALAAEGLDNYGTYGPVWDADLWAAPPDGYRIASRAVADRVTGEAVAFTHRYLAGTRDDLDDIVEMVRKIHARASSALGALR